MEKYFKGGSKNQASTGGVIINTKPNPNYDHEMKD